MGMSSKQPCFYEKVTWFAVYPYVSYKPYSHNRQTDTIDFLIDIEGVDVGHTADVVYWVSGTCSLSPNRLSTTLGWQKGMYVVKVTLGNKSWNEKIVN